MVRDTQSDEGYFPYLHISSHRLAGSYIPQGYFLIRNSRISVISGKETCNVTPSNLRRYSMTHRIQHKLDLHTHMNQAFINLNSTTTIKYIMCPGIVFFLIFKIRILLIDDLKTNSRLLSEI